MPSNPHFNDGCYVTEITYCTTIYDDDDDGNDDNIEIIFIILERREVVA